MNTKVTIAGVTLNNPVMTASGTFGSGMEYSDFVDLSRLGAVVTKGVANVPWPGNPRPRRPPLVAPVLRSGNGNGPRPKAASSNISSPATPSRRPACPLIPPPRPKLQPIDRVGPWHPAADPRIMASHGYHATDQTEPAELRVQTHAAGGHRYLGVCLRGDEGRR